MNRYNTISRYFKINIAYILFILPITISAQIGINVDNPTNDLEIKGSASTPSYPLFRITNSDNKQISVITNNGWWGIGDQVPIVKLDLRSSASSGFEGTLRLGENHSSAFIAKAGAMRYDAPLPKTIQYSNGLQWIPLEERPTKALVSAQNSSPLTIPNQGSERWVNWTEKRDETNSFEPTSGTFEAPRNGVYFVSATAYFPTVEAATTPNSPYPDVPPGIQLDINIANNGGAHINVVKEYVPLPLTSAGNPVPISLFNKAYVYLNAGEKIFTSIWQISTHTQTINSDGSYNTLIIAEM